MFRLPLLLILPLTLAYQLPLQLNVIPNEYIIVLKQQFSTNEVIHRIEQDPNVSMDVLYEYSFGFACKLHSGYEYLQTLEEVEFIEPNQVVRISATQSRAPWGLARVSQRNFTSRDYVYPGSAGRGVDIYVIDTGINIQHEEFGTRARYGYNAITNEVDADLNGHGTHVSSTAAGKTYGIAKRANLIAVKVLSRSGSGSYAGVIAGVDWMTKQVQANRRRSIANMSLGGPPSAALDRAIAAAVNARIAFAVAAGNEYQDACSVSPARVPVAVTVAASDVRDSFAYFSNYGTCVDIIAPGVSILGAWIGSTTATRSISGTSMASPHVAGVMALFLSGNRFTPAQLAKNLTDVGTAKAIRNVPNADTPNILLYNDPPAS